LLGGDLKLKPLAGLCMFKNGNIVRSDVILNDLLVILQRGQTLGINLSEKTLTFLIQKLCTNPDGDCGSWNLVTVLNEVLFKTFQKETCLSCPTCEMFWAFCT
jgi:hypothetical protein